jgi:NADH-quinone oxidoreductase subunit M
MGQATLPWVSIVVFGPLLGALALALIPREQKALTRNVAFIVSLLVFAVSLALLFEFRSGLGGFQLTHEKYENLAWIDAIGARYHVGIDGISLFLILLTTLLTPICVLASYRSISVRVKEYMIALLVLETGMLGALAALDVFLFYVFWEVMLIPMYLIIGVWGGPRRRYAAVKFFLFTMVGSLLMLLAILYIYFEGHAGDPEGFSFSVTAMWEAAQNLSSGEQVWLFLAFFLAFAIKVPLFPLHTWLPDAHVEAPTAGSVILAGVLLKMGTFGIVRYAMPMFPQALFEFAPWIAVLSVVGIVYGALMAMVQRDIKSLVAYSSVSHLGFVVLGLVAATPQGISGAVFQMLAHGVATGGLFLGVGFLYERRHKRGIDDYGGIARKVPVFSAMFVIIVLASAGLPGLNGFVGEFTILLGTAQSQTLHFGLSSFYLFEQPAECMAGGTASAAACMGPEVTAYIFTIVATLGVILAAVYLLRMVGAVFFGPLTKEENKTLEDASPREILYLLPIVLLCFVMGLFPNFFFSRMEASVDRLSNVMRAGYERYVEEGLQELEAEAAAEAAALLQGAEVDHD